MYNVRLDLLPPSPFVEGLPRLLAGVTRPAGLRVIDMGLGAPTHEPPDFVKQVVRENEHLYGKYPSTIGSKDLRASIAGYLSRRYGLPAGSVDPDRHVVPLNGTREGLFMIALAVVPPEKNGQRPAVLVANPYYHCYAGAAVAAGADPVFVSATRETGFLPDVFAVPEATLARTAAIYLCSPGNPQGTFASADYLRRLIELVRRHDIVLIVDECYAEIYDREPPPGTLEVCHAMGTGFDNVAVFHSLSKRSSAPGVRSGFCAGDGELMRQFVRLRNYASTATPLPLDAAAARLWGDDAHVVENREAYRRKFDVVDQIMGGRPGYYRPPGGFFLWLDVGDSEAATRKLWAEAAVKVVPGKYLSQTDAAGLNPGAAYIRVAIVHDVETVAEGLRRIAATLYPA